jgi:beta-lactamase superfamily II metal-dependent hydrolase
MFVVTCVILGLSWLWPSSGAATLRAEPQDPVMKAHFIDVGQADAALLEFPCGVVLIDAGAVGMSAGAAPRWS